MNHRWKLERRGALDGEDRWRPEQERYWTMAELLPTLRYVALALAHASAAPGRLRIGCGRIDRDSEAYLPLEQIGKAVITWDAVRRITRHTGAGVAGRPLPGTPGSRPRGSQSD